jgi:hypothetical protein
MTVTHDTVLQLGEMVWNKCQKLYMDNYIPLPWLLMACATEKLGPGRLSAIIVRIYLKILIQNIWNWKGKGDIVSKVCGKTRGVHKLSNIYYSPVSANFWDEHGNSTKPLYQPTTQYTHGVHWQNLMSRLLWHMLSYMEVSEKPFFYFLALCIQQIPVSQLLR